jgi:acetyl-CoA carboxylase carboxyl transferase subunit beta
VDESVLTGEGLIRGRCVAVIVSEFRFLAGSIGLAAAARIVNAVERATQEGLPLLADPPGGTRMQEGTIAFLSMVKISCCSPVTSPGRVAPISCTFGIPPPEVSWHRGAPLGHVTRPSPSPPRVLGPASMEVLHGLLLSGECPGGGEPLRQGLLTR